MRISFPCTLLCALFLGGVIWGQCLAFIDIDWYSDIRGFAWQTACNAIVVGLIYFSYDMSCQATWSCWCELPQIMFPCTLLCTLSLGVAPVIVQNFWWCNVLLFSLVIYSLCLTHLRWCFVFEMVLLEGNASRYWLMVWILIAIRVVSRRNSQGLSGRRRWFSSMLPSIYELAAFLNMMLCRDSDSDICKTASDNLVIFLLCFYRTELCRFSGAKIYPGKGIRFVRSDSQVSSLGPLSLSCIGLK
jgi:hypothetical protein